MASRENESKLDPDEIMLRRKLVLDGDGVGEDRKLQGYAKMFAKLLYSKNLTNEQLDADLEKIRANTVSCLGDMIRSYATLDTIELERQQLSDAMKQEEENLIDDVKQVETLKTELEYLKKLIRVQDEPSRAETRKNLEILEARRAELIERFNKHKEQHEILKRIEDSISEYLRKLEE